jgi:hypothetical protein
MHAGQKGLQESGETVPLRNHPRRWRWAVMVLAGEFVRIRKNFLVISIVK